MYNKDNFPTIIENEYMKKKFKQKETGELLACGISEEDLKEILKEERIVAKIIEAIDHKNVFVELDNARDLVKLEKKGFEIIPAFSRLSYHQIDEDHK